MTWEMIFDWRNWVGALVMMAIFYGFVWGMAIACVLLGHGSEVCGL